jgi:hypothetical protein
MSSVITIVVSGDARSLRFLKFAFGIWGDFGGEFEVEFSAW